MTGTPPYPFRHAFPLQAFASQLGPVSTPLQALSPDIGLNPTIKSDVLHINTIAIDVTVEAHAIFPFPAFPIAALSAFLVAEGMTVAEVDLMNVWKIDPSSAWRGATNLPITQDIVATTQLRIGFIADSADPTQTDDWSFSVWDTFDSTGLAVPNPVYASTLTLIGEIDPVSN